MLWFSEFKSRVARLSTLLCIAYIGTLSTSAAQEFLGQPLENLSVNYGMYYDDLDVHRGIDYEGSTGDYVSAAAPGYAISFTHPDTYGYGQFVLIVHDNGYSTLYAHLSASRVPTLSFTNEFRNSTDYSTWKLVRRGEVIGEIGNSGTINSHLHFEISENSVGSYNEHVRRTPESNKIDAYDVYGVARNYPPNGVPALNGCGPRSLWFANGKLCYENDDVRYLKFVEGNPGKPGDGIIVPDDDQQNNNRIESFVVDPPIPLGDFANGHTITVFPEDDSVIETGFQIAVHSRIHPLGRPDCGADQLYNGTAHPPVAVNGKRGVVSVYLFNAFRDYEERQGEILDTVRTTCGQPGLNLNDLVLGQIALVSSAGPYLAYPLDAVAIGLGRHVFPDADTQGP